MNKRAALGVIISIVLLVSIIAIVLVLIVPGKEENRDLSFYLVISDGEGLIPGTPLHLNGVKIGEVITQPELAGNMILDDNEILIDDVLDVVIEIEVPFKHRKLIGYDTEITKRRDPPLIGKYYLDVCKINEDGEPLKNGDSIEAVSYLRCKLGVGMEKLGDKVGEFLKEKTVEFIENIVEDDETSTQQSQLEE